MTSLNLVSFRTREVFVNQEHVNLKYLLASLSLVLVSFLEGVLRSDSNDISDAILNLSRMFL